jgi:tRNA A-37 threonylcarbamoyl transferase component Bud32
LDNFVGPYRILRLINQGGQGSVYLGYDKRLHRRVAIKIYRMPAARAARKELLREARVVASIQSPKVVQIHDVIDSGAHLAMVMEYVPGCSVEEFLACVRPSLASILTIGADVAGALALARQNHIVHGDVKAANVLITASGRAKLTDFGISRSTADDRCGRWAAGSHSALSPEQFLGMPLDERSDLFALGSLLYEMVCGERPFFAHGQLDSERLLKRPARPLRDMVTGDVELPDPLVEIISALLEKDPQDRPPNTRRVRQVFRTVLRSLPLSVGNSLLGEAAPCFRPESPQDIPPLIPEDLGQLGRSALLPSGMGVAKLWHWFRTLRVPVRAAVAIGLVAMVLIPVVITSRNTVTPLHFAMPQIKISEGAVVPDGITRTWLVMEVRQALIEQLDNVRIIGSVGAFPLKVFYSGGEPYNWNEAPDMLVEISLRCVEKLCAFAVSREQKGERLRRQGIMLAHMSTQDWADIVRDTTLDLYR